MMKNKRRSKKSLRGSKFRHGHGDGRLAAMNPAFDREEVHRRPLRKNDVRGLDCGRIDAMLAAASASMSRMQPDGRNGLWSILKHNQRMLLREKWGH